MRWTLLVLLLPLPGLAQHSTRYQIDRDSIRLSKAYRRDSDSKVVIDAAFRLAGKVESGTGQDMVVITENGKEVHRIPLGTARSKSLTTMFAMDVSGSMARTSQSGQTKMREAQQAARHFLNKLHPKAEVGLILFDHQIKKSPRYPQTDRAELAELIDAARPDGGTAYLDATHLGVSYLSKYKGDRAVILVTDGIDMNSKKTAPEVIRFAKEEGIPVYVLGVGDPGWNDPVSTVLVLDHSGSMAAKAGTDDSKTKIEALHDAASRFADLMRPGAKVALLPFSTKVDEVQDFTSDKERLKAQVRALTPKGGTAFYDAVHEGINTAVATRPEGKRYVVALTDGIDEDPGSRHNPDQVIELAKAEGVKLYLLGLGRKEEVNEEAMKRMARETGGRYEHAGNEEELYRVFENLSLDIHGDGIDEAALKHLARETKGVYYPVKDAKDLELIYTTLAGDLANTFRVTFPSVSQRMDALPSAIDIYVVDETGRRVSDVGQADSGRSGIVVADIDYQVYLILLAILVGLLKVPSLLRRLAP